MNPRRVLVPLLSFAAGAAIVFPWSGDSPSAGLLAGVSPEKEAASAKNTSEETAAAPTEITAEELAFTGLTAPPSLDDVFQAPGLDRLLRLALWLRTASEEEIREAREDSYGPVMDIESFSALLSLRWVELDRKAALAGPNSYLSLRALAKTDPEAAIAAALKASPFELQSVISSIGEADPEAAIALLRRYPQADDSVAWSGIMKGLCDRDPAAAAALAQKNDIQFLPTLENWADRDNKAALAWAGKIEDYYDRSNALDTVIRRLITTDPDAGLREAAGLPPGRLRSDLTLLAIEAVGAKDPEAAAAMARALPSEREKNVARLQLMNALAVEQPDRALSLLREAGQHGFSPEDRFTWRYVTESGDALRAGSEDGTTIFTALDPLMESRPVPTADLLAALPAGPDNTLGTAIYLWAESDPAAASAWLDRLPASPRKDGAIERLVDVLSGGKHADVEAAAAWGMAASPERQVELVTGAIRNTHSNNPEAARAVLESLSLSAEQKEQITKALR